MAQYNTLPIYKSCYDFLLRIMHVVSHFPKEYKYTLGERIQNASIEMVICIYKANTVKYKSAHIKSMLNYVQMVYLFLRISYDMKFLSLEKYTSIVEMIDDIFSNLDFENEDYEIIDFALSTEEERKKIEELKPDVVITDIYRNENHRKYEGGYEVIKEYSEKYFLPKFIILSYTPDDILYTRQANVVGHYSKYPNLDYEMVKTQLHCIKITERSSFMRGYEQRNLNNEEKNKKNPSFIEKIKMLFQ